MKRHFMFYAWPKMIKPGFNGAPIGFKLFGATLADFAGISASLID